MSGNKSAIKLKIKSVKSTQKITKAMKMVAAAKLKKSLINRELADKYSTNIEKIFDLTFDKSNLEDLNYKFLSEKPQYNNHLIIVTSSERGLCGAFNSSIIKFVKNYILDIKEERKNIKIICLGKKSYEALKQDFSKDIIENIIFDTKKSIDYKAIICLSNKIIKYIDEFGFDYTCIIHNKFKTVLSQQVTNSQLFPYTKSSYKQADDQTDIEFEPQPSEIITKLIYENLSAKIFAIILDNLVSEHAARMTSMDNATNSASEMIRSLNLMYNRTRQADITRELIEIISGAEAL